MTDGSDDQPIAWTAIGQHEDVFSSDGERVGRIEEVLGTGEVGIFHGIVVKPHRFEHSVAVLAQDVDQITRSRVTLKVAKADVDALPAYVEEHIFSLGVKGIFRHRPGWISDK